MFPKGALGPKKKKIEGEKEGSILGPGERAHLNKRRGRKLAEEEKEK